METRKVYLGDGLYAQHDGYQYVLTAENGISVHDTVALEPRVLEAFFRYVELASNVTITVKKNESDYLEGA